MTVYGFGLVLAAAFCHAIWNLFVKRINGGPELVWLFSVISVALYLPLSIFIVTTQTLQFGVHAVAFTLGSALLHLAYFLLLQQGYRRGDLSLVYPIARATGPLLSTAMAVVALGERVNHQIAAGCAAVIVGVIFLRNATAKMWRGPCSLVSAPAR
jgi:drug/metabolite transporter (DMT)-like permease